MPTPTYPRVQPRLRTSRIAAFCVLSAAALAAQALPATLNFDYVLAPHEVVQVPVMSTVQVTDAGSIRADGRYNRIGIAGTLNNRGAIRAGFNSEGEHGIGVSGTLLNEAAPSVLDTPSLITTMRLEVTGSGQVINRGSMNTGLYVRPDGTIGPFFSSPDNLDLASWAVLFSVGANASIDNESAWANRGDGRIEGTVRNNGFFTSLNIDGMVSGGQPYAQLLRVEDGGTIINQGRFELHANNTLVNAGFIDNKAGAELALLGGQLRLEGSGQMDNFGTFTVGSGGLAEMKNGMANVGFVDIDAGGAMTMGPLSTFSQNRGTLRVNGTLTGRVDIRGGDVIGGAVYNPQTGRFEGGGTINGETYLAGTGPAETNASCTASGYACLKPGNSPGQMTINGQLTMDAFSILELEIGRAADGTLIWDTLFVDGANFLDGSLIRILVGDGAADLDEHLLDLIRCGSDGCDFSGARFELLGAEGRWNFDDTGLHLLLAARPDGGGGNPVPVPGSLWLLAGVLPGLHLARRRTGTARRPVPQAS